MRKEQKESTVVELKEKFEASSAVFVTQYRGLTVKQSNELRRSMDKVGAKFRVAKNTLAKLACAETDNSVISDDLIGPTGLVFVDDDPAAAAKALCDFAKDNEKLVIVGGALGGNHMDEAGITALSKLPSREQLLGQLVGVMAGPMRNLVGVMAAVPRSMVQVLSAISEEKEKAA